MTNPSDYINARYSDSIEDGLTKREYFAAQALAGLSACPVFDWKKVADTHSEATAIQAVVYADELIKALNKTK